MLTEDEQPQNRGIYLPLEKGKFRILRDITKKKFFTSEDLSTPI